jgi:uncharacterized RDD family membrane protein YckC
MTGGKFHDVHGLRLRAVEGLPLATFRARALAFVVDGLVLLAVLVAVRLAPALIEGRGGAGTIVFVFDAERVWDLLAILAYFGVITWATGGQTPGKRALGIRVVTLTHDRLTLWQSIERALGYIASTLEFGFGFLQYFLHPNRQTVHDRIAETIVVEARGRGSSDAAPPQEPPRARHGKRRRHRRKR